MILPSSPRFVVESVMGNARRGTIEAALGQKPPEVSQNMLSINQRPKGFDSTQMFSKPRYDQISGSSSEIDQDEVDDLPSKRANIKPKLSSRGSFQLDSSP